MVSVVNIKHEECDVYIGRPSKWGNPFSHKEGTLAKFKTSNKKESLLKYKEYILNNDILLNDIFELKDKKLGCFCSPSDCHGDILIEILKEKLKNSIF